MAIDDLFKAMEMFKSGAQHYQQTQAVNDARQKLGDLQSQQDIADASESQMREYRVRQQQIGQDLALRLTAANAAPLSIQAATSGLVPSASEAAQNEATLQLEKTKLGSTAPSSAFQIEKMKSEAELKKAQIMADAALGKNERKDTNDMMTKFEKMPEVMPYLKNMPVLEDASNKMHENAEAFGSTAITNLVKMGVIKASVSRVSQKEIDAANESASAWSQLQKQIGIQVGGEAPKTVQDFWTKVVDNQLENSKKSLKSRINQYSQSNPKVDPATLEKNLLLRHNLAPAPPPASNVAADNLEQWARERALTEPSDPKIQLAIDKARQLRTGRP